MICLWDEWACLKIGASTAQCFSLLPTTRNVRNLHWTRWCWTECKEPNGLPSDLQPMHHHQKARICQMVGVPHPSSALPFSFVCVWGAFFTPSNHWNFEGPGHTAPWVVADSVPRASFTLAGEINKWMVINEHCIKANLPLQNMCNGRVNVVGVCAGVSFLSSQDGNPNCQAQGGMGMTGRQHRGTSSTSGQRHGFSPEVVAPSTEAPPSASWQSMGDTSCDLGIISPLVIGETSLET